MIYPKIYIGPMTKNVVDAAIKFANNSKQVLGFIPSRRQIEYDNGYVNNWNTKEFSEYVKSKTNRITLQRDHSGPGQGKSHDLGVLSLIEDCKYLDLIHIDPWKQFPDFQDGLEYTVNLIKMCYSLNSNIRFEIGTEQSIREFTYIELELFIESLKKILTEKEFNSILYLVIQSGTSLKGNNQTGNYDSAKLINMISVAKKFNLLSKEHNGDYISVNVVHEKFNLGLDAINIAPEFGLIETQTYLDYITDEETLFKFWEICYKSNKWVKWVDPSFDPIKNKIELIKICGHYVLSYEEFFDIMKKFPYINEEIQNRVITKLTELHGY
jgi:hypothetical protein